MNGQKQKNIKNFVEKMESGYNDINNPFLIANRLQTPDGTILWSRHVHDYVEYEDKNGETYILDGGNDYIRTSLNHIPGKSLCVYSDDDFETIRKYMLRGTFDKDGNRIWIPLYKMNDLHLVGVLDYNENLKITSIYDQFIRKEIEYRKEHNIKIEDGPYNQNDCVKSITKHGIQ